MERKCLFSTKSPEYFLLIFRLPQHVHFNTFNPLSANSAKWSNTLADELFECV